jgi:hypothetical protein
MSDNLRRYRAILDTLQQLYPTALTKQQARHLRTLAALIYSGPFVKHRRSASFQWISLLP